MSCDNCLCNLHICKAECCKEFTVKVPLGLRVYRGMIIKWIEKDTDMQEYFRLHGCMVYNETIFLKLDKYKRKGERVSVFETCSALKDNKCSLHGTEQQPKICHYPNKNETHKNIYLTPNCIYKQFIQ